MATRKKHTHNKPTKVKGAHKRGKPPKPSYSKQPSTWAEVFRLIGLDKVADHTGDSYGQRGAPGSGKRREHDKRRTRKAKARVSKKKRKPAIKRKQSSKRTKRRSVGTAKGKRRGRTA